MRSVNMLLLISLTVVVVTTLILSVTTYQAAVDPYASHVWPLTRHTPSGSRLTKYGMATMYSSNSGYMFSAELLIGSQSFKFWVDTGSSDLWVPTKNFTCYNVGTNITVPQDYCGFAATYDPSESPTFRPIPNQNYKMIYGDKKRSVGSLGTETISLGGITVHNQTFGLVDESAFSGGGIVSGILGLSYPSLTQAYPGTNSSLNIKHNNIPYNPIFTNMWQQNLTSHTFSLALNRELPEGSPAGYLTFGRPPPVETKGPTIELPMLESPCDVFNGTFPNTYHGLEEYIVTFDGVRWTSATNPLSYQTGTNFPPRTFTSSDLPFTASSSSPPPPPTTTTNMTSFIGMLDSGTTAIYLDHTTADQINASFDPPAFLTPSSIPGNSPSYDVFCNATAPQISFSLGGQWFDIDSRDMIQNWTDPDGKEDCSSAIQRGLFPWTIGVPFLLNTVVEHDVGNSVIRITARKDY